MVAAGEEKGLRGCVRASCDSYRRERAGTSSTRPRGALIDWSYVGDCGWAGKGMDVVIACRDAAKAEAAVVKLK
jgi:hypothetical protein